MGKSNSRNQPKEARPEKIRHPNALRKFFNRFRRKHRVEIPNISQNIQEESTAIELTEFDSSILEAYEPESLTSERLTTASFETDEITYVLVDLVRGNDLYHYSKQMGRMPEEYARFYSAEAIIALNYLHTHGIIHRDVKLGNILVNNDGHIKLADYGACRKEGPDQNYRSNVGTKMYKATEFIQDLDYNKAVDFWAIGTVIFELLVGFHPFLPQETCENEDDYIMEAIIHKPFEIPR
ncbi:PRKCI [Cordylochernes scorpioides]|uniref:Serine/threonine-protein kinase greatwall n=1 Tax=Cordylochernes scorpioides TaxID=51811 RepID=A0ABY6KR21_9ARAC|nr:PRKCI [Cordylochernes scorpioides]